jgi:hypothetical protein
MNNTNEEILNRFMLIVLEYLTVPPAISIDGFSINQTPPTLEKKIKDLLERIQLRIDLQESLKQQKAESLKQLSELE